MTDLVHPSSDRLAPFEPFRFPFDLDRWLERVERQLWGGFAALGHGTWEERDGAYELTLSLPEGFRPEDVSVVTENGVVTVSGSHAARERLWARIKRFFKREVPRRRQRVFRYAATLPREADPLAVEAAWKSGELTLRVAKEERTRARRIQVRWAER